MKTLAFAVITLLAVSSLARPLAFYCKTTPEGRGPEIRFSLDAEMIHIRYPSNSTLDFTAFREMINPGKDNLFIYNSTVEHRRQVVTTQAMLTGGHRQSNGAQGGVVTVRGFGAQVWALKYFCWRDGLNQHH